jgi:hypothetical protein
MRSLRLPEGWNLSTLGIIFGSALVIGLSFYFFGWYAIVFFAILVGLFALFSLWVAKTAAGRKVGEKLGLRLARTRLGKKLMRSQMRAQAKKQGVALTDPTGRQRSDVELQLDLYDTPETRMLKQQMRSMNPQQRAQFIRMLEAQSEAQQRGDLTQPQAGVRSPQMPRPSGKPVMGAPRSRSRKRKKR